MWVFFFFLVAPNETQINNFLTKPQKFKVLFTYIISAESFQELFSFCLSALLTSFCSKEASQVSFFQDCFICLCCCLQILKLSSGIYYSYEFPCVLYFKSLHL